jgi:cell division protein FtsI/penicillin-binding protein 2
VILIIAAAVAVAVAAGVPLGLQFRKRQAEREQRIAATSFARAWTGGTLAALRFTNATGDSVAAQVRDATAGLTTAPKDAPSSVAVTALNEGADGDTANARLSVSWTLAGDRTWRYQSTLPLQRTGGAWLPRWEPGSIHPDLTAGATLAATSKPAVRGDIIGAGGTVLVTERPVVVVGLQPSRTNDVDSSARQIAALTGVDGAALAKRANAAGKDAFVEVITLRQPAYDAVRDRLQPIPGAVFQQRQQALAPTAQFARTVLGTVGTATGDVIKDSNGRVLPGDLTGLSGLQRAYDEQLAGTPGLTVTLSPPAQVPAGAASAGNAGSGTTLFSDDPVAGKPLRITLDEKVQLAAEAAIAKAPNPAGMVVIQPSTGDVLAVANGPANAAGYNRALLGQYPPGSTFKVVSTLALLRAGFTRDTPVACPATINIGGRTFSNAEDEVLGTVPFHRDFADSCNTAFVGSSRKISQEDLAAAATSMGYGNDLSSLGIEAFGGQVPVEGDAVAHAATMIGQGQVLASPLTVAGTAGAVAAGRYLPPRLVLTGEDATATSTPAPTGGVDLPADSVAALRSMMREVVTNGTGTPLRGVAGGPVAGKTGTAEFGSDTPPKTHAWFTGFQGDVAFAVVVEDGGFGAETAAPIAADLLNRLAR